MVDICYNTFNVRSNLKDNFRISDKFQHNKQYVQCTHKIILLLSDKISNTLGP